MARSLERQRLVGGGEDLMGGSNKEDHAYSKNPRWGRNTHIQVCLQFWFSAGAGTKCYYATAQFLLHERTLPTLTSPWDVPHANTFCTDLLNLAEAALYHV